MNFGKARSLTKKKALAVAFGVMIAVSGTGIASSWAYDRPPVGTGGYERPPVGTGGEEQRPPVGTGGGSGQWRGKY